MAEAAQVKSRGDPRAILTAFCDPLRRVTIEAALLLAAALVHAELALETRQLTSGPENHLFGYIGHVQDSPWNQGGRHLVASRTKFCRRSDGAWVRSQGFAVRGWESGDFRCDPAPCWNRNNRGIAFPAIAKDGTRQMFQLRLKE